MTVLYSVCTVHHHLGGIQGKVAVVSIVESHSVGIGIQYIENVVANHGRHLASL